MAGVDTSKEESANFYRLTSLLVDVGSEVLRDVLLRHIKDKGLEAVLQANVTTIDNSKLYYEQKKILKEKPPDAEKFDISLLCALFRDICPKKEIANNLKRLKDKRNSVYAHRPSTKVKNAEFEPLWNELSQIIVEIAQHGSHKLQNIQQRIEPLRNENLDPSSDCMLEKLRRWQEQDETISQQLNKQLQEIHKDIKKITGQEECEQVGPCTCRTLIKVPEDEAAVHTPDQVITNNLDSNPADQNFVCLIKMYAWLKEEMTKKTAKCIASQLFLEDHVESIEKSCHRRMAVDMLLKFVLRPRDDACLKAFLKILDGHCESADRFRQNTLNATEQEAKDCFDRNKDASRCNEIFCDQPKFKLRETDKQVIHDNIKDIVTIDRLNNEFLSKFHFSLAEHQRVCDHLYIENFNDGATRLLEIMEKCPRNVAYCFCDMLKQLEDKKCIPKGLVQDLQLREKYCLNETAGHTADDHCLFSHMARWCLQKIDFILTEITRGSIIIHMRPNSEASWRRLEELCSSGQITDLLKTIFEDEKIRRLMPDAENGVLFNIYREADPNTGDAVSGMAILTLEHTSESDKAIQGSSQADKNPLILNMDLFSEELEICDELIQRLKEKQLIPEYTEEKLKETTSRSSEITCLLHLISSPERGYEAIKEYLISADKDLYGQLVKREENRTQRELIYTVRQKIPVREFNANQEPMSDDTASQKPIEDGKAPFQCVTAKKDPDSVVTTTKTSWTFEGEKKSSLRMEGRHDTGRERTGEQTTVSQRRDISQIVAMEPGCVDVRHTGDKEDCDIRGIAVTSNGTLLLADCHNRNIKSVSPDNKILSVLPLPNTPIDITILNSTTAVAASFSDIHIIDVSNPSSISWREKIRLGGGVYAITNYHGNLVTGSVFGPSTTRMIDLKGKVLWEESDKLPGKMVGPRRVNVTVINNTATVIVTDSWRSTLTLLEAETGSYIRTIDVTGKAPGGITVDRDGNVYVCYGRTKEICVWSNDFKESRILLSQEKLKVMPLAVAYSDVTDSLYVSYYRENTIDCFRLQ